MADDPLVGLGGHFGSSDRFRFAGGTSADACLGVGNMAHEGAEGADVGSRFVAVAFFGHGFSGFHDVVANGAEALFGFGDVRGWAQQLYWGTNGAPDSLVGGDPLNTAVLPIWGFLRSAFGVAPTLSKGFVVINQPALKAEGAVWNVSYLGESVCLVVKNQRTTFCNGTLLLGTQSKINT